MFKSDKVTFNALKKMPVDKRIKAAQSSAGPSILGALTPTDFALLFPKYYQERLPDVGGFREAMTRQSLQRRQEYDQAVADKLGVPSPTDRERATREGRTPGSGTGGGTVGTSGKSVAVDVGKRLIKDYGLTNYQAAGILAHLGHESAGFKTNIQEGKPISGRGGFGLAQWTGPRRVALENFASKNGMDINSVDTQYAFMVQEPEFKRYIGAVKNSKTMEEAAQAFAPYESGGDPRWVAAWGSRYNYGRAAMAWLGEKETEGSTTTDTANVSKVSDSKGGVYGNGQCVALSKHFSGLGAASEWKVSVNNSAIVPGTVIATTSYNDRSGGKMAKDMPDGQSHYHTGIALTAPDANGNVLILDQFKGRGAGVTRININDYHGEKWGVVEGGQPSAQTMQAVALGKSLANPDQLAWINSGATTVNASAQQQPPGEAPKQKAPEPSAEQVAGHPESQKPSNATKTGQSQDTPTETATVKKPEKKTGVEYKFNEAAFEAAVREKYGMMASMYDRAGLVEKFKSELPPGVTYENGILKISDPNSPEIKSIREDLEKEFGKKTVNSIVTENKPEQTATVEKNRQVANAEEPPPQAHAGGGRESVRGPLSFVPIPPRRGDDMLATDASGKQFTFNKKENIKQDNSNTVKIEQQKVNKQHLLQAMNERGIKDANQRAAMAAVVHGESGFMPRSEKDYSTTSNKRIRSIFKSGTRGISDAELTNLKKNPEAFFNKIYGGKLGNAKDEGYKYRGRGMVQLTGKANYAKYGEKIGMKDELLKNPDLANQPDIAAKLAVAYMEDRTRKRGKDVYSRVARGVGNPVADTEKVKVSAYQQYAKSGDFAPGREAVLPVATQYAQKTTPVQVAQAPTPGTPSQTTPIGEEPGKKTFAQRTQEALGIRTATAAPKPTSTTPPGPKTDVTPTPKVETPPMMAQQSDVRTELSALRNEMTGALQKVGQVEQKAPEKVTDIPKDDPTFLNRTLNQGDNPYMNPSFFRAVHRAKDMSEPTGGLNGLDGRHYSTGTKGA